MKQTATNSFQDGMNLDLHPIVTPNSVLTDNLNGTFITYNGNEFCLQNDKGNTIKSTLTEGFIPIGIKEHAGVLYIFSHNPETGEGELGTFPGVDWSVEKEVAGQHFLNKYTPLKTLIKRPVYNTQTYNSLYCFISNGITQFTEHSLKVWSDNFGGILEKFVELGMTLEQAKESLTTDSNSVLRRSVSVTTYPKIVQFIQDCISNGLYKDKYGRNPFANGTIIGDSFYFDVQWIGFAGDSSDLYSFNDFYKNVIQEVLLENSSLQNRINNNNFIFERLYRLFSISGFRIDENWNRTNLENLFNDLCRIINNKFNCNLIYYTKQELKDYPTGGINWDLTQFEELRTTKFNFDLQHPVDIEVQDSYDGSVNLIITDNKNTPRIINTEFSVVGETYKLVKRYQKDYLVEDQFESLTSLIKNPVSFSAFRLKDVYPGGQLKGGNYTFYAKLGDADGNQTDIVAESGVVSIFNGAIDNPSTISGTLADERTDKLLSLTLYNISEGYSRVYLYYTREYSDTQGYLMEEVVSITKPFDVITDIDGLHCDISITGFEDTSTISVEDLNIRFYTNDYSKSIAQQQGMLFLANVGSITYDYSKFDEFAKKIKTSLSEIKAEENPIFDELSVTDGRYRSKGEYYDVQNIYSKVGYWPNEYYRFGIVFILADGSSTSVFNMNGGEVDFGAGSSEFTEPYANKYGVFHTPKESYDHYIIRTGTVIPWHFRFDFTEMLDTIFKENYADIIKGYFIVRQKRIPEAITQGLHIGVDVDAHVPIVPWVKTSSDNNKEGWFLESFVGDYESESTESLKLWYGPVTADGDRIKPKRNYLRAVQFLLWRWAGFNEARMWIDLGLSVAIPPFYAIYASIRNATSGMPAYSSCTVLTAQVWYDPDGNLVSIKSIDETSESKVPIIGSYTLWFDGFMFPNGQFNEGSHPWSPNEATYKNGASYYFIDDEQWASIILKNKTIKEHRRGYISWYIHEYYNKDITLKQNYTLSDHLVETKIDPLCSGLLSVEATLCPSIKNRLNGSTFYYEPLYQASCKIENSDDSEENNEDYSIYGRHQIISTYKHLSPSSKPSVKAVYVGQDNVGKYLTYEGGQDEGDLFATVIGNAHEQSDIATISGTTSDNRRNVIRGKFPAFIGLGEPFKEVEDPENPLHMEICQVANRLDALNAISVRSQDNSPYYAVSDRMSILNIHAHVYRGDCFVVTETVRMISNFIDPDYPVTSTIVKPNSWNEWYLKGEDGTTDWTEINSTDLNTVSLGQWITFKCLASSNIGLRSEDTFDTTSTSLMGNPKSFYPLCGNTSTAGKQPDSELFNSGYGKTTGQVRQEGYLETPYVKQEYANRIMFSNKYVTDEFTNGYRVFQGLSYQDYDKQYGQIIKILPWGNNLFCAFEHGLALLPVNEKALLQTTTEQTIHIYGHGVLPEQMSIISQDYGTKHANSIVRTPIGIYGVDVDARKIWRFSDKQGFETLSDMKIESFLNSTLKQLYTIDISKCDVRTHYNSFKGDVIFTWYDEKDSHSICFNERQSLWVTRYDWCPLVSENINGEFYSLQVGNDSDDKVGIYKHDVQTSRPTQWYGKQHPFEFEFVVSDPIGAHKIYENLQIISNNVQPEELQFEFIGDAYMFNKARIYHTVFNQVLTDKRKFGNEFTRRLKLYASDPSKRVDSENVFNKTNVDTQENENGYTPFRNVSILNDRNNIPLRGHVKKTENATEQYHLVIPQECRNIETWGRRLGNMHYKNDFWFTTIEPIIYDARLNDPNITTFEGNVSKWNSTRIRDKWCKIRVRYSGEDLAIITAIKTMLNI